jgi:general secretion pathway protein E
MITFDEENNSRKIDDFKKAEEEDVVQILAEQKYNMPYINLNGQVVENQALQYIKQEDARAWGVGPFKLLGKNIHIGVQSPERGEIELLSKDLTERGLIPHFYMISKASLEKVWERYGEISLASSSRVGGMDVSGDMIVELGKNIHTLKDVENMSSALLEEKTQHKVSKLLEIILAGAISLGVSDVHIEPEENFVKIRLRLDGVLQDVLHIHYDIHKLLNSRLKLMSGMKLTANAIAQDGRFSIFIGKDEISMRVSVVPGAYGEGIVMRILNPKSIRVKLEDMGIDDRLFEIMMKYINKPNGLILITGPTGSGKTTTLYAFLSKIYSSEIKIMTIEDPVEYHLEGVSQTQVDHEKGYNFAAGLRAALRQDPDVIMVGEIRDSETAETAIEASNTGHLVFSTLHTNSAAGVIPRLIDLGVNPKILVSALKLSLAQRLCRKLCKECKKQVETPNDRHVQLIKNVLLYASQNGKDLAKYNLSPDMPITLWEPVGCEICNMTGYKGRIGLFEAIETDEAIEKIIPDVPSERDIIRAAIPQGIFDMREDGVIKILRGVTSVDEVMAVVDLYVE